MRGSRAAWIGVVLAAACSSPTAPPKPDPGPATAPVIRAITVPASRVEVGQDITITAVVEDAETPLAQLAYQWSASAGTITGNGATATWRMPEGIAAGLNVTVTLTVIDTYDTVVNNQIVKRQFVVASTSPAFRVHDSVAEVKELARKFLVDLFGDSSVPPAACMVDFTDLCAERAEGKIAELAQIVAHRAGWVVISRQLLGQRVVFHGADAGSVHSAMLYVDRPINSVTAGETCGDFQLTMVYAGGRWWICESFFNEEDRSLCPTGLNDGGVAQVLRGRGTSGGKTPGIRR